MSLQERNSIKQLCFSGLHIKAHYLEQATGYYIENPTVVINPGLAEAQINEPPHNTIPALSSTILKNTRIAHAAGLILLELAGVPNIGNIILDPDWALYGDLLGEPAPTPANEIPYPKDTPLWRSPQDSLGSFLIDPYLLTRQASSPVESANFEIKVNLWFAPANTNCFIHNKHDFIEIHSQIYGLGSMQKFKAQDYDTIYEDLRMSPGYTTPVPFCRVEGMSSFVYPWHQYYAETDCIWLAIEYHPCLDV